MSDIMKLFKSPRVLILIICILASIFLMSPSYEIGADGKAHVSVDIQKGLDLQGGVRALLLPAESDDETVNQIVSKLNLRINAMGLKETKVYSIRDVSGQRYVQVEMAGTTEERMREMLEKQGKFEAKIRRPVLIADNSGNLMIGGESHEFTLNEDETVTFGEETLSMGDVITLEEVEVEYLNKTDTVILFNAKAYDGEDVVRIFRDQESIYAVQGGAAFQFNAMFGKDGAERFAKITQDVPLNVENPQYIRDKIDLYLDDAMMDSLNIGTSLKGKVETTITISGGGEDEEDAVLRMRELQAILESGALPTTVEVVKIDTISPTLGAEFMRTAIIAIIFSIIAVALVIFVRYKSPLIAIPIMITSTSEVILILGFAALVGWTIDLPAIAGIIAAIGSGVDDQIIITDESGKKKRIMSLKQKLANAFFIIFAAAFTTIAAMTPLLFVGAGGVKGFALTTIVGVTIGITITRPAFGRFIEYLKSKNKEL